MAKLQLRGKDLRNIGYPEGPVISVAINTMQQQFKHYSLEDALKILSDVLTSPAAFENHPQLGNIAKMLQPKISATVDEIALNVSGVPFNIFGSAFIEEGALLQMETAAKLPVSVAGALMPDAHVGYGLPIGGVLATENAVIPYGVGVDIGCRMSLSVYDLPPSELLKNEDHFRTILNNSTKFGSGGELSSPVEHPVLERKEFDEIPFLKGLQERARRQLGTSGSGNHFAEFGIVEVSETDDHFNLKPGIYVGFLTHSGSRGLGANVANHFTKIATQKKRLPTEAQHLAWFELDEEEGVEYWKAMNLAGDYASACHHVIHDKVQRALKMQPLQKIENHHNFAWKETIAGTDLIVHRKGATPAGKNVLGIIPGSMTAPGYIVKGKGEDASLHSASHGAGRTMSRTKALNTITNSQLKDELKKHGVTLIGGGLDEAPFAYKDINMVMQHQKQLISVLGKFYPKIVKMDAAPPRRKKKKSAGYRDEDVVEGE